MSAKSHDFHWPAWSTWALFAVILTAILTVAATINDIW